MSKPLSAIPLLVSLIASLSCQNMLQVSDTQTVSNSSTPFTKIRFPEPWLDPMEGGFIQQIEVRKVPSSTNDEFFFGGLPYGDNNYAHEVDKKMPPVQYGRNVFAVTLSVGPRVRVATREEWESGSRIPTRPRPVYPKGQDDSSGEVEYRQKRYSKVGKYWGSCMLSPTGKWLALFSYTGEKQPPDFFFGGGDPRVGDVFWQIYDAITGTKVIDWQAKNVKNPTRFDNAVVWLEDRYFLFPEDDEIRDFTVVTLPPVSPEVNPVTLQLPSRIDSNGRPLAPGRFDEVWIPLSPLTKEQAAKLTARSETTVTEVRLSQVFPQELLLAINEEIENRQVHREQRDGDRNYHFRLINTHYYAVALDNPTLARVASKEEWDRGQAVTIRRPDIPPETPGETVTGTIPPYRQFPKTGTSWGSPPRLSAGEWIAIFSYSGDQPDGKIFVDIFDQRLGNNFLSTTLPFAIAPNELLRGALWIDGGYILLPLNSSFESFAFWRLP